MGKTHLAIAIGVEAVRAGREVRFVDCAKLVEDLKDASSRGILKNRLKYYAHSKLLIIDELGYLDIDEQGADLMFQLVSTRYEQRSTIITTNVGIGGWAGVFGDEVAASAIADRVCHHCTMLKITRRSYRLKDLPAEKRKEEQPKTAKVRWFAWRICVGATGTDTVVQSALFKLTLSTRPRAGGSSTPRPRRRPRASPPPRWCARDAPRRSPTRRSP